MHTTNQLTEIVYVCSPNQYENMLFTSLRSLLKSNSTFDKLTIFCIGQKPKVWEIVDSRIQVIEVEPLRQDDFLVNKTYALTSQAQRLIFIDSDTLIINPIDSVYQNVSEDFIARPGPLYRGSKINQEFIFKWQTLLKNNDYREIPYFNSGFFIFQNSSHQRILKRWRELTNKLLFEKSVIQDLYSMKKSRKEEMPEQTALSLSIAESSLTYKCMEEYEHVFAWQMTQEFNLEKVVVVHTGGSRFFKYIPELEIELGLIWDNLPKFKYYPNRIHFHRWNVILKEVYKKIFKNKKSLFSVKSLKSMESE